MSFDAASHLASVTDVGRVASTFDLVDDRAPHLTTWATLDQTSGRGRLGREWVAPAGACLAATILVRPTTPVETWGWMPLAAGLAVADAIDPLVAGAARIKWPNDVLVGGKKVAGILCELRGDAVAVGIGVNLTLEADALPVDTASSLRLAGAEGEARALADTVLAHVLTSLDGLVPQLGSATLRDAIIAECETIGREATLALPDGSQLRGLASGLGPGGELRVESEAGERLVAAGDVVRTR